MIDYFKHESAYVDEGCHIGKGTKIWYFSHIMSGCVIGDDCNIGQNVVISLDVRLGRNVKIQNNGSVYTGVVGEGEFRIYDLLGRDVTRQNGSLCGIYVVKTAHTAVKIVVR